MKKSLKIILALLILLFSFYSYSNAAAKRALLVGINDYSALPGQFRGRLINDLKGAVNDINAMKNVLITSYGFSEGDIHVLIDDKATRRNIETVFNEWLVNGTKNSDTVVFYFSGHGSRVKDFNGDEEDGMDEVLLPYDMVPRGGYNIIIDDELGLWLKKLDGRHVVVFIDSCHSGGVVRSINGQTVSTLEDVDTRVPRFLPITDYKPTPVVRSITRGGDVPESVIFMAASRENEIAIELKMPQGYYGGFSFGLFDAMKNSNISTYEEVFNHARKVVKDRLKLPQDPQILVKGNMADEPAFGKSKAEKPQVENIQPAAPPEIKGERVLIAVENMKGFNQKEIEKLRDSLRRLSIVELVEVNAYHDRLIRGEKSDSKYHLRLVNGLGDVEKIEHASTLEELVASLSGRLEYAYMIKQLAGIYNPNPAFKVKLWVNNDNRRDFRIGEKIVFGLEADRDSYVLLINLDSQGNFHIMYPNKYQRDNYMKANNAMLIPDERSSANEFQFEFGAPAGEETVKVIATTRPLNLDDIGLSTFNETFQTISGKTRAILIKRVIDDLSSKEFVWSEDTIVVRSHE